MAEENHGGSGIISKKAISAANNEKLTSSSKQRQHGIG